MRQNNGSGKKSFNQYSQYKRTPIEYYLQKISLIKNDSCQFTTFYKQPQMVTHTDLTSSFYDLRKHQLSLQSKKKDYQKKRSLSTKTEIEFISNPNVSRLNVKTQYGGKKYKSGHQSLFSKMQVPDQRIKQRTTSTYFKVNLNRRNNQSQGMHYVSQDKMLTEPFEQTTIQELSQRLMTQYPQQMTSIKQQIQQSSQTAKKDIFTKISLYVQSLDEKGEQQLNQILVGKFKRHIKCHTDVMLYEQRIKQMIETNKQIVHMLKQQFLSPSKVRQFSQRNPNTNMSQINNCSKLVLHELQLQSPNKKKAIDDIEFADIQHSTSLLNEPKLKPYLSNNSTKPLPMQNSQSFSHIEQVLNPQQQTPQQQKQPYDYNQQIKNVTNQFVNQWQKSKLHKKQIYQKFRKTLFKKFPQFKQRQIKKNKELNIKPKEDDELSDYSQNSQNPNIFNSKIHLDGLKQAQLKANNQINKTYKKSPLKKKQKQQKSINNHTQKFTHSQKKQIQLIKNSSQQNQKDQLIPLKNTTTQLSKSLSKITLLSKKNSISKGSTKTLSILTAENKKQVDKFNFQNLVEFIFKRAFFYSVSKKKIIQNKTEMIPLEIVSPTQKKKPDFSFITYNSKAQEKRYLRMSKLNEKRLRATGNFLIKNKFNIMNMQQQGNKSYDFLRKCIEDAIQDYLSVSKKK